MKQIEPHSYVVAAGENITVEIQNLTPQIKLSVDLDGEQLERNKSEYNFTASHETSSHRLLMEFLPITSEPTQLRVHLIGSQGGDFGVPIEIGEGITQTRFFRFMVKDRPFSIGVG